MSEKAKVQDQLEDLFGDADMEVIDVADTIEEAPSELPSVTTKNELGSLNLGLDFSALGSLPGVVVGDTGIKVQRYAVPRIKFTANAKSLISIVTDQVIVAKTHYDEEIGSNFLCFNGDCCNAGLPRIRYVYPVVVYDTDTKGKPISKDLKYGALCIGSEQYDALQDIQDMKGSLTQFDLLVTCQDEKYQKITITEAGNARWAKIPGAQQQIAEFWNKNMKDILKGIARTISPEEYAKLKGAAVASAEANLDFDDVFGE